jgi:hypothetical protein
MLILPQIRQLGTRALLQGSHSQESGDPEVVIVFFHINNCWNFFPKFKKTFLSSSSRNLLML